MSLTGSPETPNTSATSTPSLSSAGSLSSSLGACSHLSQVLNSNARETVLRNYTLSVKVAKFNSTPANKLPVYENKANKTRIDPNKLARLRTKSMKCKDCKDSFGSTFMCLQCPHIGCWDNQHFINHAKTSGHVFGRLLLLMNVPEGHRSTNNVI